MSAQSDVFENNDDRLREATQTLIAQRAEVGLYGLVAGLASIFINVELHHQRMAVTELLAYTGYQFVDAFEDATYRTCVLKRSGSADILVRARLAGDQPFASFNRFPKSAHLPNTRLETFCFRTSDLESFATLQQARGYHFMYHDFTCGEHYRFLQTAPSVYTGNSFGFIQWTGETGNYRTPGCIPLDWPFEKPDRPYLASIGLLDHAASRVHAEHRDLAILELMDWTNYRFDFSIYVPQLNSITNVARLPNDDFAMVITSGIYMADDGGTRGPTESFVKNFGPRVHHLAFRTEEIDDTVACLEHDGLRYLSALEGSEKEGIKQIFAEPSSVTLLVIEYIQRFGDFDGFFTSNNVAQLTAATAKQSD